MSVIDDGVECLVELAVVGVTKKPGTKAGLPI